MTASDRQVIGPRRGYLPTLDGWRAIAILGVMFHHDSLHAFGPFSTKWFFIGGGNGVDVFFAISGILICSRLLEEESIRGRISLRNFYVRRAFRILPAAFAYLLVIALLSALGRIIVYPGELAASLLFLRNYPRLFHLPHILPPPWFTAHFWTLSIEEHFYFLLPGLLVIFKGRWRIPVLSLVALLVIGNRAHQLMSRPFDLIFAHTDVRLDALLIPALLAVIMRSTHERLPLYRFLRYWPLLIIPTVGVMYDNSGSIWQTTALVFFLPCVIMGSVLHSKNILGRFLELAPLRYIGRISYSLYLWQMLFFTSNFYPLKPLGFLENFPYNFIATFVCALASYYFLEMPMIRLGHKFAPSTTPGRTDLVVATA